ncbi:hypothetical protein O181_109831, partial [Austropuccinia psidii MF-1]|nr:hypothetical protein [Austropuccinia psidii MF-1]
NSKVNETENENEEILQDFDKDSIEIDLAAGARAFAFKNFPIATDCFSKACEKLDHLYGNQHPALIDAYISYGKALLHNAISLSNVLSQANNPINDSDGIEEISNGHPLDQSTNQLASQSSSIKPTPASSSKTPACTTINPKNPHIHFSGDSSDEDDTEENHPQADEHEPAEEAVTAEEELESAFQVLENARQSLQTQIDSPTDKLSSQELKKLKIKLTTVHELLAEVHQESEQFESAVESYINSLEVKQSAVDDFSPGSIAENHLMIALALELIPDNAGSLEKAVDHVDQAIDLMKRHLVNLETKLEKFELTVSPLDKTSSPESSQKKDHESLTTEIEEVKSLISELESKKEELKTIAQPPPMTEKDKALQAYLASVNPSIIDVNGKMIVNDLSNLVKKRQRPNEGVCEKPLSSKEELTEDGQSQTKKLKAES